MYSNYTQPFYYCLDCNEEIEDESKVICVICALHCHRGHKLQIGAYGLDQKVFCDCGGGSYNGCKNLNNKNPLSEEFKKVDEIDIKAREKFIDGLKSKYDENSDHFK